MKHRPAAFVRSLALVALWAVVPSSCSEPESPIGPGPSSEPLFTSGASASDGFFFTSFTGSATATTTGSGIGTFFPFTTEFGTGPGSITDDTPEGFAMARGVGATKETRVPFGSGSPPCSIDPFAITESGTGFSKADPVLDSDGNPIAGKLSHTFTYHMIANAGVNSTGCVPENSASGSVTSEVAGEYHVPAESDLVVAIQHDPLLEPPAAPPISLTFEVKDKETGEVFFSQTGGFGQGEEVTITAVGGKELLWRASSQASASATGPSTGDGESAVWDISMFTKPAAELPGDVTPPVITSNVVGTLGNNGRYTSDVTVSFTVTDAESAITASSGCATSTVTSDTDGTTFTCTATSGGGTASNSVTIKRDATPPTVTYSGNAGTYTVDQTVSITCAAADATNPGSGLASSTCQDITGDAYTFPLGINSYSATATDHAGNQGSGSTSFEVIVTFDSLCNLTRRFVSHAGIANSLCAKLQAAKASAARGNTSAKAGQLEAYRNEVQAQAGKHVPADKAPILISLSNSL